MYFNVDFDSSPPANYSLEEYIFTCVRRGGCGDSRPEDQLLLIVRTGSAVGTLPGFGLSVSISGTDLLNPCPPPLKLLAGDCGTKVKSPPGGSYSVTLNFPPGFFYEQDGAYGSGVIPGFQPSLNGESGGFPIGRTAEKIFLRGESAPLQISMLNGPSPSTDVSTENIFEWDSQGSDGSLSPSIVTTNPYEVGVDSRNGFLSGVMFGVAGAALVTLIVEAMRPKEQEESAAAKRDRSHQGNRNSGGFQLRDSRIQESPRMTYAVQSTAVQRAAGVNSSNRRESALLMVVTGSGLVLFIISAIRSRLRKRA